MSRRPRVSVTLNTGDIKKIPDYEIRMILRAADELISVGGRSLLAKLLKGSKDKRILEHKLNECPAYGFYHVLALEEITHRIDWVIKKGYLHIDYNGQLPVLVFSEKGWTIEEETYAEELYQRFCRELKENKADIILEMKDVNRQVVFDVLEKIRASKNEGFIPMLEAWKEVEVRKVRERISSVEKTLVNPSGEPYIEYRKATKYEGEEVANLIHKTVKEVYPEYYPPEVVDYFLFHHRKERVTAAVQAQKVWVLVCDGLIIGTGSAEKNHITGVYVLPEYQGRGYGTLIMQMLEKKIAQEYSSAELDASRPAYPMYEKRGYRTIRHEQSELENEVKLEYEVMEKELKKN